MNIKGLDYNTQRDKLLLSEYGREVQEMIAYAITLPTKAERQHCAETIIGIMRRMTPHDQGSADYEQKLWDHLALMSQFQLDIDYPYDVNHALDIARKPEPLSVYRGFDGCGHFSTANNYLIRNGLEPINW